MDKLFVIKYMRLFCYFLAIITIILICCDNESTEQESMHTDYAHLITKENRFLEAAYQNTLEPIISLKSTDPKVYWFIVSWLNTQYRTPNWKNYNSTDWKVRTKLRGIDCSGFARVMQQEVFDQKIKGGSQGILNTYCKPENVDNLEMGDLVFFKAPNSRRKRIVHVGVYIKDGYFVHATSKKSAARGLGLNISSLQEKRWKKTLVTGGSIRQK